MSHPRLSYSEMLQLQRWNTPTVFNGWEQITKRDYGSECFNLDRTTDYMPQMGVMIGRAVTVVIQPSHRSHKENKTAWKEYRDYVASVPGPKIAVVQDLDKPRMHGSFWGEVNANVHKALGCVGTITDGAVRDLDEMTHAGFKALAAGTCVGHAYVTPVRWGCEVTVFGVKVEPGQLIHADKHGFMVVPAEDERLLLEASLFMDRNEIDTKIAAATDHAGKPLAEILADINRANADFARAAIEKYGRAGE